MIKNFLKIIESKKNSSHFIYKFLYIAKHRLSRVLSRLDGLFIRFLFGNKIRVVDINNISAKVFYFYNLCFKEHFFDRRYIIRFTGNKIIVLPKFGSVFGEFEAVELYFKKYLPEEGDIVIDGGAHNGLFTIVLSLLVGKTGKVISFEPDRLSFKKLVDNVGEYGLENVILVNKGLFSRDAELPFSAKGSLGSAISAERNNLSDNVSFVAIDSELENLGIKKVNYIKMDIEGAEIEAVKGCERVLLKNNVHLAIASYHKIEKHETRHKLEDFFFKTDYCVRTEKSFHTTTYVFKEKKRIVVKNIKKTFKIGCKNQGFLAKAISFFSGIERQKIMNAIENVSFSVGRRETLGIIGDNGSGKSTLLRIIAGIYNVDSGQIITEGKIISLINLYIGLKDRLTMKDNIFLVASLFGLSQKKIKNKFFSIVEFSELQSFVDTKLYQFSLGMLQRLSFAIAIHCDPDILLLDEVFEVGDEEFRKKSAKKIKELVEHGGSAVLVSHDMHIIKKYCDKVLLINKGKLAKTGKPDETVELYLSSAGLRN